MKIHAIINDAVAGLSIIKDWAEQKGFTITTTKAYEEVHYPEVNDIDMLIILGGEMGAYEEEAYPWLKKEKEYISKVLNEEKAILGICLGAQLIAEVLGGKVFPHTHNEIGWWEVQFNDNFHTIPLFNGLPKKIVPFQFHGDTFTLPKSALHLASSEACENQAYIYGNKVVGLQFHPEFTKKQLENILSSDRFVIKMEKFTQLPEQFLKEENYFYNMKNYLFTLLDNFERIIKSE